MAQGMNKLNEALAALPEVRELLLSLDAGTSPIAVSGLSGVHRAQLTAAVRHKTQRPLLIVCADENEANRMAGDLHELLGEDVSLPDGRVVHPGEGMGDKRSGRKFSYVNPASPGSMSDFLNQLNQQGSSGYTHKSGAAFPNEGNDFREIYVKDNSRSDQFTYRTVTPVATTAF